jgi:Tfp pilus assembly protein PilX
MRNQPSQKALAENYDSPTAGRRPALQSPRGVALILVMLAMLVLTMLAATIVFTARAETFASNNYKLDTQADYLAKAGIQRATNWFRSSHYQAVTQSLMSVPTTQVYQATSTGTPFFLYLSNGSAVQCNAVATYACTDTSATNRVKLIGYGSGSSNYPDLNNTEVTPRKVITAFASDLNNPANTRITADVANSGYFNINATMLYYQTVILTPPLPSPLPSNCVTMGTRTYCAVETWMITSKGTWTGVTGSTTATATAEEEAIVQPIFWPTWGNALYGYCSVDMTGSSGTCTDAFNSSMGAYAMGNGSVASGVCDSTSSSNVISTGAGVGANGGVTLGSNVSVGGNVTIGTGASAGCTASGYSGSTSSVLGEVINGPQVYPPPVPTFPAGFPSGAPSYSLNNSSPAQTLPVSGVWPTTMDSSTSWPAGNTPPDLAPPYSLLTTPCMTGLTCNGTSTNPYLIANISMTGSTVQLVGGPGPFNPVYYDIGCLSQTGGSISVSGYVVLNVQGGTSCSGSTGMDLEGNGISNGIACTSPCTNIPPEAVQINYAGSTKGIKIGGNGAISAVINAPLADVSLGGGGANGYMVGAIQANTISVSGGYPIHYDVNLARVGGTMGTMISTAYGRKKM